MHKIVVIAHDIRSTHNVGSLLRTAEGLGISHVYLTGYTPYPSLANDIRLPHITQKLSNQIHKTALGAEHLIAWSHASIHETIGTLKDDGFTIIALEQTRNSIPLADYQPPQKVALVLGREVEGIAPEILDMTDTTVEIPMNGKKESFNVSIAAAICLYALKNPCNQKL